MRVYYFLDAYFNAQTDTFGCKIQVFITCFGKNSMGNRE